MAPLTIADALAAPAGRLRTACFEQQLTLVLPALPCVACLEPIGASAGAPLLVDAPRRRNVFLKGNAPCKTDRRRGGTRWHHGPPKEIPIREESLPGLRTGTLVAC